MIEQILRMIESLQREIAEIRANLWAPGDLIDYSSTSTIVGFSSYTTKKILYKRCGKSVFVYWDLRGTGSGTSATFTLPETCSSSLGYIYAFNFARDDATFTPGTATITPGGSTVTLRKDVSANAWTDAKTRNCIGEMFYEIV